ncbi:MAG: IS630 family transposase [Planctomycetota bacterium]|nr:IS630 family transposase [Planctomycetota bacterium]
METGFRLEASQRQELVALHRKEHSARYADRLKTILWRDEGITPQEISHLLFRDEDTVRHWERVFRERGLEALLSDHFQPYSGKLEQSQERQLYDYVKNHLFLDVGPIQAYVEEEFGVSYTVSGMRDLLHRLGFVYKKASSLPGKADPERQQAFVAAFEELMRIKEPDTPVLFMDGVHPSFNSLPSYGWIPKGGRAEVPANTGRERVNLNGAIDAETHQTFVVESESVNAQSTVELFAKIEAWYPHASRIYVFSDNAKYYHSRLVADYLKHSRLRLEFLPPYSPNLNLIERLWRFLHQKVLNNRYYPTFRQFREELLMFFDRLPEEFSDNLRSLLTLKFHPVSGSERRLQAVG